MKDKFNIIKNYEEKMPGIKIGLNILSQVNKSIKNSVDLNKVNVDSNQLLLRVNYYNFEDKKVYNHSLIDLNFLLLKTYNDNVIAEKVLLYNQLYWVFCNIYEKRYKKHNYTYNNGMYTMHDVLKKFFHILRKNKGTNPLYYSVIEILKDYNIRFFDHNVSTNEFRSFMLDFILDLSEQGIVTFVAESNSILFNELYYNDLSHLINTSFNLMLLGENGIYQTYNLSNINLENNLSNLYNSYIESGQEKKNYINDLLISLVLCCTVENISVIKDINNIFIENI